MYQITRFVNIFLNGTQASANGYFTSATEANDAYAASLATMRDQRLSGVPTINLSHVGTYAIMVDVPDFSTLDEFTGAFFKAMLDSFGEDRSSSTKHIGPDTIINLVAVCQNVQNYKEYQLLKTMKDEADRTIWNNSDLGIGLWHNTRPLILEHEIFQPRSFLSTNVPMIKQVRDSMITWADIARRLGRPPIRWDAATECYTMFPPGSTLL